ncbi:Probable acyl-activating enzyme 5- peroxisomal [Striga hermonthica]|uniref:Probable acyl-activating enzyme 5- peroxisomal n=1 Tax=Striga hermonthica TaxID=68872 RepID=A0A9N7MT39_STRHE|nr:Probable acyl-activating enzyme 5- peroxisomal [Striga hermonthica]
MLTLKQTLPIPRILYSTSRSSQDKPTLITRRRINNSLSSSSSVTVPSPSLSQSNGPTLSLETETAQPKNACPPNLCPLTPIDFLERAALVYGDCPSIVYHDTIRTWSETQARCHRLASSISSLGIERGNVVSVLAPNVPAMCELHFAVPMAGAILNTVNLRLDSRSISNILLHAESKLVFVDSQSASLAREAVSMLPLGPARPVLILIRDKHYENTMPEGAPPPPAVLARIESLGFAVSHGYGLTETGGLVVTCAWKPEWDGLPGEERARMKSRQGVPLAAFSGYDVVDPETGRSMPRDGSTVGEIVLKGGSVMLGYLKDPKGTSGCMKGGWLYTGDVGVVHEDGYLEVKDRSKDVIICGGENMSSVEVEAVLYGHPAVNEAAVVARPSAYWGETPCAFVSLKGEEERPTEKDIRDYCKERLPLYMVPRKVVFKDELPKTSTGKLQKFLLREMAKNFKD